MIVRSYRLSKTHIARPHISFKDPKTAYGSLSTIEVVRSWAILNAFTLKPLVKHREALYSISKRVFGSTLTHSLLRHTIFKHFCGGEDGVEIQKRVSQLRDSGIGAILDYAAESDATSALTESYFERNVDIFEKSIRTVHSLSGENFAAIKITGLASPSLLEKVSAALPATGLPSLSSLKISPLDLSELENAYRRLDQVCSLAESLGVGVMIDAEWTTVQPAIDFMAISMMKKHNKNLPIVSTTYQCYLKVTPDRIQKDLDLAKAGDFKLGAKVVRGAYLVSEATRSPGAVCDSYEITNAQYNAAIQTLAASPQAALVVVASHNTGRASPGTREMTP
jgi:proline dehydrogenase